MGRVTTLSYDAAGRLTSKLDARGVMTTFVYDNADRPTARVYSRDANVDLGYDAAGNSTLVRNVASLTTITYDALNRPVTEYLYPGADPRVRGATSFTITPRSMASATTTPLLPTSKPYCPVEPVAA